MPKLNTSTHIAGVKITISNAQMDLGHLDNKYYDNDYCKNYLSNGFLNLLSNLKAFILVKLNQDLDVFKKYYNSNF